ncbi:MAG: hypothetical protein AAGG59_13200 [Bacteroidota bacterium]
MKVIKCSLSALFMIAICGFMACGDDDSDGPTLSERQLEALQGEWSVSQDSDVMLNSDNAPGDWSNFNVNFMANGLVTVGGAPTDVDIDIFELSSFEISGDQELAFDLIFNGLADETASVRITDNGNGMILSFSLSSNDDNLGTRTAAIQGGWEFLLTKS